MRPNSMTDQNRASVVSGVAYGVANEMLQMTYNGGTETRTYNTMFQLTNISGLGQKNSNSFTATLLSVAGIFLPTPPDSPGWGLPLLPIPGPLIRIPGTGF